MNKGLIIASIILLLLFFLTKTFFQSNKTSANNSSASLTTKLQWEEGSYSAGIDLTSSPGDIKLIPGSTLDLTTIQASQVTTNFNEADKMKPIDGDYSGGTTSLNSWLWGDNTASTFTWQVDLGSTYDLSAVRGMSSGIGLRLSHSENGVDWTAVPSVISGGGAFEQYNFSPSVTARYFKQEETMPAMTGAFGLFREMELVLAGDTATHTTHLIDGGENFWSWDEHTFVQTVPANTSVTYQYRTKAANTDWTPWVGGIGGVTSRTGNDSDNPTRYQYLQIKATLTNTDGVSTPAIDSYTIDYHTEQKPGVPTAQTAVVE